MLLLQNFVKLTHTSSLLNKTNLLLLKSSIKSLSPTCYKKKSSESIPSLILLKYNSNFNIFFNNSISNKLQERKHKHNQHLLVSHRYCSSYSKIYTKSGDKGTSALYNGERRSKDDCFFDALGNIDELSSFIGLAKEFALEKNHDYVEQLERIQCILQDIATIIATPLPKELNTNDKTESERLKRIQKKMTFNNRHILELESWIDHYTQSLPPLTNFILPGGGRISASLHIARTVCRRTERAIVALPSETLIDENVKIYVNRLSDYLFTIARHSTILDGKRETIYIRPKPQKELKDEKQDPIEIKKT